MRRNPSSYLVVVQDRPPGDFWRARADYGPFDSLETAKAKATREADEFVDAQKGGWTYRAAIYTWTGGTPGDRPVAIVRPSKAREAAKAKARKASELRLHGRWEELAKLERWPGRQKRWPQPKKTNPSKPFRTRPFPAQAAALTSPQRRALYTLSDGRVHTRSANDRTLASLAAKSLIEYHPQTKGSATAYTTWEGQEVLKALAARKKT